MPDLFEKHRDDLTETQIWKSNRLHALAHYHAGIELAYILDGRASAVVGGKSVVADKGEVILSSAYTVHSYGEGITPSYVIIIPPAETPSIQKQLLSGRFSESVIRDEDDSLRTMIRLLYENQKNAIMRKGLSYTILGYLMKKAGFIPSDAASRGGIMAQVLGYLSENYAQSLSVESVASHFGYSRSRFSHLFKANIGVSFPKYVNILRCRDAAKALTETDLPIVDIAINAGFNNTHTFYVTFRELYGMTPGEYANTHDHAR